jgi:uncharacterized protein (TIGR00369 family)
MDVDPDRVAKVPSNRLLGLVVREQSDGGATVAMAPRPELAQEYGVVHGGFLAALADTAAVYALLPKLAASERMTSIEFKVNFLAPADPAGGELVAKAAIVKAGRTVRVAAVDVHQQPSATDAAAAKAAARHVLTGLFTYAVMPATER